MNIYIFKNIFLVTPSLPSTVMVETCVANRCQCIFLLNLHSQSEVQLAKSKAGPARFWKTLDEPRKAVNEHHVSVLRTPAIYHISLNTCSSGKQHCTMKTQEVAALWRQVATEAKNYKRCLRSPTSRSVINKFWKHVRAEHRKVKGKEDSLGWRNLRAEFGTP